MIIGHNFSEQLWRAGASAELVNLFANGKEGVVRNINISSSRRQITVSSGKLIVQGRLIEIKSNERIMATGGNGRYTLALEIDLSKSNTSTELNQVKLVITNNPLIKENLFENGNRYQLELAQFEVQGTSVVNIEKTVPNISYAGLVTELQEKIQQIESNSGVVTRSEIQNYVTKNELNSRLKNFKSGRGIPSNSQLEEGEIYIQYF